ncbi:gustatory and pheromone receptor 32a-like [Vespula maculifrons]|uniref:Gustatory and pheromone receptor 32a-like n=1 Tax=Vespula maculifrons TaxID=7453 RepID=A0ABD2CP50_VESMC
MRQIKFSQLNELLKGMLTTTIHSPQHKRILRMRNRKNDSPSSDVHRTDKLNKDVIKIKKAKEIHLELIKCARNINDAYGLHILFSISTALILITIIRDFTVQFIQNPLTLTCCGIFDLDYTLLRSRANVYYFQVISTIITYLVILIQVGNIPQ